MDLMPYVAQLHRELSVAADAGGDEARELAERLTAPLESATRLVLLEALAAAAGEITSELAPGSVDVRFRGRDPDFVVSLPPSMAEEAAGYDGEADEPVRPAHAQPEPEPEEGGTARISLRLPEHLKAKIEEAASKSGLSVNAWLVRALSTAVETDGQPRSKRRQSSLGQHYTGWVR